MTIKLIRLITGEDIITEYDFNPESLVYTITNPLKVIYYTTGIESTDKFMISLLPWMFTSLTKTQVFDILSRDVLTTAEPSDNLLNYYTEINKKLTEIFTQTTYATQKTPLVETGSVDSEISMMENNESKIEQEEFLDMVKKKLGQISKRTLH